MGALEERSKDFQAGGVVIVVGEDRDHYYFSIVKILARKGDRVYLCWSPPDAAEKGCAEKGWYDLDWLKARALGVRS